MLGNPRPRPALDLGRKSRLRGPQYIYACAQPQRIQRVQGECSMAALRAALPAD
jgi:hypothetical protein